MSHPAEDDPLNPFSDDYSEDIDTATLEAEAEKFIPDPNYVHVLPPGMGDVIK